MADVLDPQTCSEIVKFMQMMNEAVLVAYYGPTLYSDTKRIIKNTGKQCVTFLTKSR